jgi:hypothetical protein
MKSSDTFKIYLDYIEVISSSGNNYKITLTRCSCKGFGFHKECRHYKQAQELGLLKNLQLQTINSDITLSEHAKELRKAALKAFLTKYNINFTQELINKIEPVIKITTTPQEIFSLAQTANSTI